MIAKNPGEGAPGAFSNVPFSPVKRKGVTPKMHVRKRHDSRHAHTPATYACTTRRAACSETLYAQRRTCSGGTVATDKRPLFGPGPRVSPRRGGRLHRSRYARDPRLGFGGFSPRTAGRAGRVGAHARVAESRNSHHPRVPFVAFVRIGSGGRQPLLYAPKRAGYGAGWTVDG